MPRGDVEIPPAPKRQEKGTLALRQAFLPIVTIIGYVVVSLFGQGRNLLMIVPMALSVVITSYFAVTQYKAEVRKQEEDEKDYELLMAEMRKEMINSHDMQRTFYYHNYPDPDRVLRIDGSHTDSRSGSRLWERRTKDDDFGAMRIGVGARPSSLLYKLPAAGGNNEDEQPLSRDATKLAEESRTVFDVPIFVSMFYSNPEKLEKKPGEATEEEKSGGGGSGAAGQVAAAQAQALVTRPDECHAMGIVGDTDSVYPLVRSMVAHYVAFHAPTDANVLVVGTNRAEKEWNWLKTLPHSPLPRSKDQRQFYPLCFEPPTGRDDDKDRDKVSQFWRILRFELDQRAMRKGDKNVADVRFPFLLVVVDMMDPMGPNWLDTSSLKDLESEAAVSMMINKGPGLGVGVIFLVPERRKVPSGCTAVIEVSPHEGDRNLLDFRYAEVGVNTTRYVGTADMITDMRVLNNFTSQLSDWKVRRSYGEDIPGSVGLFELFRAEDLEGLNIAENWEKSMKPENSEWMVGALGIMSGGIVRRLTYSADRDGVHGMVAGSTGSGKSELLMSLILGLCIRYDPQIINFVLIDYKGGAAFVPFVNLPHCVDIVTNLQGAAVDRMFAAINAELNRRQEINTRENAKHIVHYRQKGYHLDPNRTPYPHLFVIIDEFAEMMAGNAEYKAQLNSITRLGRALGVTLILAAQRPTGVTDQMRANIKFRISLRVETREESNEMLRRPDAAYLPPGVPGRGYLQIGNENIEMIQVAYSGADYLGYDMGGGNEEVDLKRFADRDVIWVDRVSEPSKEPPKLFEVLVAEMARLAKLHSKPQKKPWPSPLPSYIALSDPVPEIEYLHPEDIEATETSSDYQAADGWRLNASIQQWLENRRNSWDGIDWRYRSMRAVVGLIDDPSMAQQRLLTLNMRRGHLVLFGASGWGKTTFLRSAIMSMAVTHSPEELHVYILDFGGRALEVMRNLPHVGAIITPDQEERVDRLLRRLDAQLEYRKQFLAQAQANSVYTYNSQNPDKPLPVNLVIVDNFSEFRENFEARIPLFTSLIREGLANGIHFIVTGEQPSAVPGRLLSLFTERMTLKLADAGEYSTVVGRGIPGIEEIPGRGFIAMDRRPLEFQAAIPVGLTEEERTAGRDETKALGALIERIKLAWNDGWRDPSLRPVEITTLSTFITLDSVLEVVDLPVGRPVATIGINDSDLQPTIIDLSQQPHFTMSGQQLSGKTATLRSWILSLAYNYSPKQVAFVLVDPLGFLPVYMGGKHTMADLPHVLDVVTEKPDLERVLSHLQYEYVNLAPSQMNPAEIFVIIDNYDDFKDLRPDLLTLAALTRSVPGRPGLHFVVCGTPVGLRTSDDFLKRVTMTRYAMGLDSASVQAPPLNANIPRGLREGELPIGRSFVVRAGKTSMVQLASPYNQDEPVEVTMDRWIEKIIEKYPNEKATWIEMPESFMRVTTGSTAAPATTARNGGSEDGERKRLTDADIATPAGPADPSAGMTPAVINQLRQQLIEMYEKVGLPADMIRDLPPSGIVEMAQIRGLLDPEPEPAEPVESGD